MVFPKSWGTWEKANITIAVLFLIGAFSFLIFSEPSVTGHVPAQYSIKGLDIIITQNQSYSMISKDSELMNLNAILVSGKVIGDGSAKIFLETGNERYLVYSNKLEGEGLLAITGAFIQSPKDKDNGNDDDEKNGLNVEFIPEKTAQDSLDQEALESYNTEVQAFMTLLEKEIDNTDKKQLISFIKEVNGTRFENECEETCALYGLKSNSYGFSFEVEVGTILLLEEVTYLIEKEENN